MQWLSTSKKLSLVLTLTTLPVPNPTRAQHYTQKNLISDIPGMAAKTDPNLKNPWGLTRSPTGSPWWIANNNSGTSTLDDGNGREVYAKAIEFTDFPLPEIEFYFTGGVILLPSEY